MQELALADAWLPLALILVGSLFEAIYLLKWVIRRFAAQREVDMQRGVGPASLSTLAAVTVPTIASTAILAALGVAAATIVGFTDFVFWLPAAAFLIFALLDRLPIRLSALVGIAAVAGAGAYVYPELSATGLLFAAVFLGGFILVLVSLMHRAERVPLLVAGIVASSGLSFFFAWETMTLATFAVVLASRKGHQAALHYVGFSLGEALALLAGLALLSALTARTGAVAMSGVIIADAASTVGNAFGAGGASGASAVAALILVAAGILTKAGALGVHLWLPDTYASTEPEATAFFSGVVSKAAILALVVFAGVLALGTAGAENGLAPALLGWTGVATALFGALLAVFQEDVKHLLAYSSMSQVGYMVLGISLMTHFGWVSGLYLTVLHFIFKGMLFLALTGIIKRAGASTMYELGGLIKRMPLTFISVLMAIIAVSGVPPLAGFGGKWLLYSALIEKGCYAQAGVAFFASAIAFLYLFRLIHTVFLGQLKDSLRRVKEAPAPLLIPQVILMATLMTVSFFPNVLLNPIMAAAEEAFAGTVR